MNSPQQFIALPRRAPGVNRPSRCEAFGRVIAACVVIALAAGCRDPSTLDTDRFVDSLIKASRESATSMEFRIAQNGPCSIALFPGPSLDPAILISAGLEGARLEGILQAAPKDYRAAVLVAQANEATVGWFLGNYVLVKQPFMVRKMAGETIEVELRYGGELPEIVAVR